MNSTNSKWLRIIAVAVVIVALAAVIFGGRFFRSRNQVASASGPHDAHANHAAASEPGGKILYWYDPMHPNYHSDKPGTAPDCGMDLVPMREGEGSTDDGLISISQQRQQLLGIRTATVAEDRLTRVVRTNGTVAPDETRISHIHVKVPGFIEDAYVDYVGQYVKAGQPIFTFYSPDLVATQDEYLIAKRGEQTLGNSQYGNVAAGSKSMLESARERLRLWDISDAQIKKLDQSGQSSRTITFYAPHSGYVTDRKAFPHSAVTPDMDLYTLSDLSRVWVIADVYEYELPYIKSGQTATIKLSYAPGHELTGRIAYIFPALDPQTHTAKVRIDVANPKLELRPNMFADVELKIDYGKHMIVPAEAVLNSGQNQTVFVVRENGKFEPRSVKLGPQVEDKYIVLFGLEPGETIVSSGNFLLDSESRMKTSASDIPVSAPSGNSAQPRSNNNDMQNMPGMKH